MSRRSGKKGTLTTVISYFGCGLILVLAIALVGLVSSWLYGVSQQYQQDAHVQATDTWNTWLKENIEGTRWTVKSAQCVNVDSDGDGYISCSATLVDSEGDFKRMDMECGGVRIEGCRTPKMRVDRL